MITFYIIITTANFYSLSSPKEMKTMDTDRNGVKKNLDEIM